MKIAIDESGDSGKKFWKGSSRWFIVTAVVVPDSMRCGPTCQAVDHYRRTRNSGNEIHFARNSHERHVAFLSYIEKEEFIFASVCIDKRKILMKKPYVLRNKMSLLRFSFSRLFEELHPYLDSPVVLIDTNGSKQFNRSLSRHLMRLFGPHHKGDTQAIGKIRSVESSSEPLVQLADYVSGAVHHHVSDKHHSTTYQDYLAHKGKIIFVN